MPTARPRVLFLTIGDASSPGTRLRSLAYLPYLRARGLDVEVRSPLAGGRRGWIGRWLRPFEILRDVTIAPRFAVVVLYRKTFPSASAALLAKRARRVVYEFDDAVYLPAPSEPQDERNRARYRRNFASTLAIADHVVAGNRVLAAAAGGRPVTVLPTAVDLEVFRPREPAANREGCMFGWIGTAENLAEWSNLVPAFRRVLATAPASRFKVVSNREPPKVDLPVVFERFTVEREAAALEDFDVGLMPLTDSDWNRGKCSAKALQCMAMGMPVVVSPVGMNRDLVEPGVSGFLADGEDEWVASLGRLASSAELRQRIGTNARSVVEEQYALTKVGAQMADLIASLVA
jgi:glycosyltransferase involved in cell wall biosynthesis